jgi:hypothetical protein
MFSVGMSMEEFCCVLIIGNFSLFKRLFFFPYACAKFLFWWWYHENQFPNVSFLAK